MSETEPELGMGVVTGADKRYIDLAFDTKKATRRYCLDQALLRRILFKPGDRIQDKKGVAHIITSVIDSGENGIVTYCCGKKNVPETELADTVNVSTPLQKLLTCLVSSTNDFDLRLDAQNFKTKILGSPVRGFVGGRIDLLAHQMNIAETVSQRKIIRALLADETGLGKTIETCLILHRLQITGRASRVLVVVPEHLVHQWFVELFRRFNSTFTIIHEESCAIDTSENPFLADSTCICSVALLSNNPIAGNWAVDAGWDLVIVDEAHHLEKNSQGFGIVKSLSEKSAGLLLLTATPEQLGQESHFARLQLLDPQRYVRFSLYEKELTTLRTIGSLVALAMKSEGNQGSANNEIDKIEVNVPIALFNAGKNKPATAILGNQFRTMSIDQVIDLFGTGRTMFRNTRQAITGFPERSVKVIALDAADDAYIVWLVQLLKSNAHNKILVICSSKSKAIAISEACLKKIKTDIALFHEDMTIIQRDRNAAWFSEENGARMLVCSEIGSEGRNFQFCQCLVLFDLPLYPELVEQRIGRLDRIGQKALIHIYVPFIQNTAQETLCRFYHEGLDAFNRNIPAAGMVFEKLKNRLLTALSVDKPRDIEELLCDARAEREACMEKHLKARDQLFDIVSFQPKRSKILVETIQQTDVDSGLKAIMERLFKRYGILVEDAGKEKFALVTEFLTDSGFPLPRSERPVITYNRTVALEREDVEFITIDHPMVTSGLDLFMASDFGVASFATWSDAQAQEILLETVYIVECMAPAILNADRFLPSMALRCVMGHTNKNLTEKYPSIVLKTKCANGSEKMLKALCKSYSSVISKIFETSKLEAQTFAQPKIRGAIDLMRRVYDNEISRMEILQDRSGKSAHGEMQGLIDDKEDLEKFLLESTVRLDAIRLIYHGPARL